ncbi:MAG: RagB/SusD family nutrient uptake outer membrane protein [Tannerella sp.]|nr:RagB/SusD family nutrient uptake outer membrane protein [Tannerella sp.]
MACVVCTVSCDDFLKEEARGKLTTDVAFTQKTDAETSVTTLYRQVSRSSFGITQYIYSQMGDDLSTHPASNKLGIREWDKYEISTNNDRLLWCWEDKFKVIKAANYIINGVENAPAPQEEIDYALGQAHFWRAWAYFTLVRAFGPLPKVLSLDVDYNIGLSPVSEIFDLIVEDLKTAEEKLPINYSGAPKTMNGVNVVVNKAGAQAVLSAVYLSMAGWPLNKGTEYYSLAAAEALKVIDGSENGTYHYELYDEYWKIHSKQENLRNRESVCAVIFSYADELGDGSDMARGGINDIQDICQGWTDSRAEIGFWVDFPEGPRKEATYATWTFNKNDKQVYRWWSEGLPWENRAPYFAKSAYTKYGNENEYDFTQGYEAQANGWQDQIHQLVRLAELYLFYAEAIGRSGQTNARAIELLNKVRNRADGYGPVAVRPEGQNVYPAGMSASELAEAAYTEHGWEIAGWYWGAVMPRANDMQRMNRMKDHFNKRKADREYVFTDPDTGQQVRVHEQFGVADGEWHESKMFAPYPSEEVERNPIFRLSIEEKLNMIN